MTTRVCGFGLGVALVAASLADCGGTSKTASSGNGGATGSAGTGSSGTAGANASGTGGAGGSTASGAAGSGSGGVVATGAAGSTISGSAGMTGAAGSVSTGQGGKPGIVMCTPGVQAALITDCGYPTTTGSSLAKVTFSENEVLAAIQPEGGAPQGTVRLFYNDEHALTLGVRSVVVKTAGGAAMMDYPVSALMSVPGMVTNAQLGTTELMGDQSGLDQSLRPIWPVLYLTDITSDPQNRSGDWQQGGVPTGPNDVFGTWKSAVRTVDKTVTPNTIVITPDKDPAKNMWDLGAGADPVPAGLKSDGYGAEVRWTVAIAKGHSYRVQVIVHDGDQNKGGGDCGEACVLFCAGGSDATGAGGQGGSPPPPPPPPTCPTGVQACGGGGIEPTSCPAGTVCANGCCLIDNIIP